LFCALVAYSWLGGDLRIPELFTARRAANLERFLTVDLVPLPMRDVPFSWSTLGSWAGDLLADPGLRATGRTLAISVLAIVLAGLGASLLTLPAARNFMVREPFLPGAGRGRAPIATLVVRVVRLFLLFIRSVPEFIWAYLFLAMFGPTAWPAVLALALHNTGTLGKLSAEVVENIDPRPLGALRSTGTGRFRIALFGLLPLALPRFLLYFFYRFETCVREATILGMIGIVSLGYYVSAARAVRAYDEMLLFVLLGAAIVLGGDLVSALTRRIVRRAV
jgi:phosphonate transport system permease protein